MDNAPVPLPLAGRRKDCGTESPIDEWPLGMSPAGGLR